METAEHTAEQMAEGTIALPERLVPPTERGQRLFRGALVVALFLHAMLFVEVGRSVPRTVGDRSGSPDAISVDLVTEADLKSRETVAMPPPGAPAPTPPQPRPQEEAAEPAPPTPQPEAKPEPQPKAEEPQKAEPAPKAAETPKAEKTEETSKSETPSPLPDFSSALPDLATIPQPQEEAKPEPEDAKPKEEEVKKAEQAEPAEKREPTPAKKQPQKQQKQARLEPQPQDLQSAPPGRSASATRPPGITRSGENDEFGRGVVRALRMTMPPPRGIFGRVTVRLLLNENGDLAEVQVLQASGTPIDQSVVFATKQTYFPLPPYNSSVADRTFIITYVYR